MILKDEEKTSTCICYRSREVKVYGKGSFKSYNKLLILSITSSFCLHTKDFGILFFNKYLKNKNLLLHKLLLNYIRTISELLSWLYNICNHRNHLKTVLKSFKNNLCNNKFLFVKKKKKKNSKTCLLISMPLGKFCRLGNLNILNI